MSKKNKTGALTAKQEQFAASYVELGNGWAAYKAAYDAANMSDPVIRNKASELRADPRIAARIVEIQAERERRMHERFEITIERVIQEYAQVAFANMADYVTIQGDGTAYVDLSQLTRQQAAAIAAVEVDEYVEGKGDEARHVKRTKFKLHPKLNALDSIARHLGMFKDKPDAPGRDGAAAANDASPRDLARAILDIFSSARLEGQAKAEET